MSSLPVAPSSQPPELSNVANIKATYFLSQRKFVFLLWNPKVNCDLLFFLEFDTVLHQLCLLFFFFFFHFAILFSESSSLEGFKTGPKRARVFSAHLIVIELYCEQKGKTLQSRIAFIILFFPRHDVSSVLAVSYPPEQVVTHDFNRLTGLYSIFQPLMTVRSWLRFFFFCHQHLINK